MRRILFDAAKVYSHGLLYLTDINDGIMRNGGAKVHDWNHNGKIDAGDHAFTAFMMDQMENGENPTGGCGCCGTTVAMFRIAVLLPVIVLVVR